MRIALLGAAALTLGLAWGTSARADPFHRGHRHFGGSGHLHYYPARSVYHPGHLHITGRGIHYHPGHHHYRPARVEYHPPGYHRNFNFRYSTPSLYSPFRTRSYDPFYRR